MIVPVILSGGGGTRLWPVSTPERPKQFLPLVGKDSLIRQTVSRVADRTCYTAPVVVASAAHEALCQAELGDVAGKRLILEPIARNTGVAIVMAAAVALREQPNAMLLVMPSDHRIGDEAAFHRAVQRASMAAQRGLLVTFGVQPSGPETGYGYLQAGEPLPGLDEVYQVARFQEKPDLQTARGMLAAGGHFWNGGIFMFLADRFLEECRELAPELHRIGTEAISRGSTEQGVTRPDCDTLMPCPNISVDYAVMERSGHVAMVPLDAGWSDVGSWDALADLALEPPAVAVTEIDTANCYVRTDGPTISLLGVEDLIVVATADEVVIMKRGRSQDIRRLVKPTNSD